MSESEYAEPDYEPTPKEAEDAFSYLAAAEPGHGSMEMVPALEKWMWGVPGVWWSHREQLPNGRISVSWLIPEKLPH